MISDVIKKHKGIVISGLLLILLSFGFTSVINFCHFYDGNMSKMILYFIKIIICIDRTSFIQN